MKVSDVRSAHSNAPDWVAREAARRFPLDLSGRVEWIREQAETCVSEGDAAAIYAHLRRVRNGRP